MFHTSFLSTQIIPSINPIAPRLSLLRPSSLACPFRSKVIPVQWTSYSLGLLKVAGSRDIDFVTRGIEFLSTPLIKEVPVGIGIAMRFLLGCYAAASESSFDRKVDSRGESGAPPCTVTTMNALKTR